MVESNVARIRPPDEKSFRLAPHNIEAEQALLGAILVNNDAYYRVSDFLKPIHFNEPLHRKIYELAGDTIRMGKIATTGSLPKPWCSLPWKIHRWSKRPSLACASKAISNQTIWSIWTASPTDGWGLPSRTCGKDIRQPGQPDTGVPAQLFSLLISIQ